MTATATATASTARAVAIRLDTDADRARVIFEHDNGSSVHTWHADQVPAVVDRLTGGARRIPCYGGRRIVELSDRVAEALAAALRERYELAGGATVKVTLQPDLRAHRPAIG